MAALLRRDLFSLPSSLGQVVDDRGVGRIGAPEKGEGGDGDPGQEDISQAHVDVDHQNVVAAAEAAAVVDDEVAVGTLVAEGKDWEGERGAAKESTEKR